MKRKVNIFQIEVPESSEQVITIIQQNYIEPLKNFFACNPIYFFEIRNLYTSQISPQQTRCYLTKLFTIQNGALNQKTTLMNKDNTHGVNSSSNEEYVFETEISGQIDQFLNNWALQVCDQQLRRGIMFQNEKQIVKIFVKPEKVTDIQCELENDSYYEQLFGDCIYIESLGELDFITLVK